MRDAAEGRRPRTGNPSQLQSWSRGFRWSGRGLHCHSPWTLIYRSTVTLPRRRLSHESQWRPTLQLPGCRSLQVHSPAPSQGRRHDDHCHQDSHGKTLAAAMTASHVSSVMISKVALQVSSWSPSHTITPCYHTGLPGTRPGGPVTLLTVTRTRRSLSHGLTESRLLST